MYCSIYFLTFIYGHENESDQKNETVDTIDWNELPLLFSLPVYMCSMDLVKIMSWGISVGTSVVFLGMLQRDIQSLCNQNKSLVCIHTKLSFYPFWVGIWNPKLTLKLFFFLDSIWFCYCLQAVTLSHCRMAILMHTLYLVNYNMMFYL